MRIQQLKVKQVAVGSHSTLFIDLNDNVWAFGSGYHGLLGVGNGTSSSIPIRIPSIKAKQVTVGGFHSLIVDLDDDVWGFGSDLRAMIICLDN